MKETNIHEGGENVDVRCIRRKGEPHISRGRNCAIAGTTSSSPSNSAHLLAEDAEGVLTLVLSQMPLHKVMEFRLVCKLWRILLMSQSFLENWEERQSPRWIVMERRRSSNSSNRSSSDNDDDRERELLAYDHAAQSWLRLSDFHPTRWNSRNVGILKPSFGRLVNVTAAGDGGGLLCFVQVEQRRFVVLNPLTGFHAVVPFPAKLRMEETRLSDGSSKRFQRDFHIRLQAVGSAVQPQLQQQHFRIFLYESGSGLYVYHSNQSSRSLEFTWDMYRFKVDLDEDDFEDNDNDLPPLHDIDFLYLSLDRWKSRILGWCSSRKSFQYNINYETDSRLLSDCQNLAVIRHTRGCIVFFHGGHLYMASMKQAPFGRDILAGFYVAVMIPTTEMRNVASWTNYDHDEEWVEVASTPLHLWQGYYEPLDPVDTHDYRNHVEVSIVYGDGLVCMTAVQVTSPFSDGDYVDGVLEQRHFYVPLLYDMDADSWHHLPPPPPRHNDKDGRAHDVFAMCSLRPSFRTTGKNLN